MSDTKQLGEVDLQDAQVDTAQKEAVAQVENDLHGILKGINTYRTKREETASAFATKADAYIAENAGSDKFASATIVVERSGVKKMGIYILAKVTLTFASGETAEINLKSKMKTWNASATELPKKEPKVKAEKKEAAEVGAEKVLEPAIA